MSDKTDSTTPDEAEKVKASEAKYAPEILKSIKQHEKDGVEILSKGAGFFIYVNKQTGKTCKAQLVNGEVIHTEEAGE